MPSSIDAVKQWLGDFLQRHEDALARGFLLALGLVLAAVLLVDPASLLHRHFHSDRPPPDHVYVARKIYQSDAQPFDIVVIGGSSTRELIPPPGPRGESPAGLCQDRDRLLNAATSSQQPADGYAILSALPRAPELVVVGLTGRRLIGDRRNDPYALDAQVVELPRSNGAMLDAVRHGRVEFASFDFFDQLRRSQWTLQTAALAAQGMDWPTNPNLDNRTAYPDTPRLPEIKQLYADKLLLSAEETPSNHRVSIARYWVDFADHVSAKGGRILFVMTPTSPEAAAYEAYMRPLMDDALQDISAKYPLLDLRHSAGRPLGAADFFDPIHVSHTGRDRLWPETAAAIRRAQACDASRRGRD